MDDNVTRIHPQPSIPNPLMENPWADLTDAEIEDGIFAAQVRIDGAQHTARSLTRERDRRAHEASTVCDAWYHGQPGCTCPTVSGSGTTPEGGA